jgi:hypothetical protein
MSIGYAFCLLTKSGSWQESNHAGWENFHLVKWPGLKRLDLQRFRCKSSQINYLDMRRLLNQVIMQSE